MKLEDYKDLESLAATNAAPIVNAADLLAWREEMVVLRAKLAFYEDRHERLTNHNNLLIDALRFSKRMYQALVTINTIGPIRTGEFSTQELIDRAPDEVKQVISE